MWELKYCDLIRHEVACDLFLQPIAINEAARKENKEEPWVIIDDKNHSA